MDRPRRPGRRSAIDLRFDTPLYTRAEAAAALGVPPSTFRNWANGYRFRKADGSISTASPIVTTLDTDAGGPTVPFVGLAEGLVLSAFRARGVPMQRIRPALDELSREMGIEHALASHRLYTDGAEILVDVARHGGDDPAASAARELVVIRNGQRVFEEIVAPYLGLVTFADDGWAARIRLPIYRRAEVIADPRFSFGAPTFARGRARVADALERFWAGDDAADVAAEFGVPVEHFEDVLRVASRPAA